MKMLKPMRACFVRIYQIQALGGICSVFGIILMSLTLRFLSVSSVSVDNCLHNYHIILFIFALILIVFGFGSMLHPNSYTLKLFKY